LQPQIIKRIYLRPYFTTVKFISLPLGNKNTIGLLLALFGTFLIFPCYYETTVLPLAAKDDFWQALEPSWALAINYTNIKQSVWGIDAAFTYGPLGNLCTRIGWGENRFFFLFFDLFMALNYFLLFFYSYKHGRNKIITALLIVATAVILPYWHGPITALILMLFLVFWVGKSLDNPRWQFYVFQIIIVCLLFYIKFNTGLIVFALYFVGLFYNAFNKEKRLPMLLYAIAPVAIVFILSWPLHVAIGQYVTAGMELISGFNDVMYLDNQLPDSKKYLYAVILLFAVIMAVNLSVWKKAPLLKNSVILFLLAVPLFVLYKQSFVRADPWHLNDFFILLPLLMLCNTNLHTLHKKWLIPVFVTALSLPFYFLYIAQPMTPDFKIRLSKADYLSHFFDFTPTSGIPLSGTTESALPQTVLSAVGKSTVDIFPWNGQLLIENELNYLPRPVFQSYSTYTPYLEDLNFNHYNNAAAAPNFVLYELGSIDNRYAIFDEPKVTLALMRNYTVDQSFLFKGRQMLLLRKNENFRPVRLKKIKEYAQAIDAPLRPEKDIFYSIRFSSGLQAKAISILDHTPEITLEIQLEGEVKQFKTAAPLLKSGVFSQRYADDTNSFKAFLENSDSIKKVMHYRFKLQRPELFGDKIGITTYKVTQE
jgi:hypothetical protein